MGARQLEEKIFTYAAALKFIGEPFMGMGFIAECYRVFIIYATGVFVISTLFYYKFIGPVNVSLLRAISNQERELKLIDHLIDDECKILIDSSRSNLIKLVQNHKEKPQAAGCSRNVKFYSIRSSNQSLDYPSFVSNYYQDHLFIFLRG